MTLEWWKSKLDEDLLENLALAVVWWWVAAKTPEEIEDPRIRAKVQELLQSKRNA